MGGVVLELSLRLERARVAEILSHRCAAAAPPPTPATGVAKFLLYSAHTVVPNVVVVRSN